MESVGKHHSSYVRRSLPQITQIYTDIGCREKGHESHGCSTRKIRDNPWNLWENISQAACEGASHRLHRFTRILGAEEKDTNHTDVAQEKSVTIRDICGKHSLKQDP